MIVTNVPVWYLWYKMLTFGDYACVGEGGYADLSTFCSNFLQHKPALEVLYPLNVLYFAFIF